MREEKGTDRGLETTVKQRRALDVDGKEITALVGGAWGVCGISWGDGRGWEEMKGRGKGGGDGGVVEWG